jgi:TPR repeat protein
VKDEAEAARYFKLSADQNHASAQFNYAFCLVTGRGLPTNDAEAARYFKLAAEHNDALPQFHYALCLANEQGIMKNEVKLVDITNLRPIRITQRSNSIMRSVLRMGEAL